MIDGRVIRAVDCNSEAFRRSLARIRDQQLQTHVRTALRTLLLTDLDAPARALHLHQLSNKQVPSALRPGVKVNVWTIHVTPDDAYKASFTLEDGTAYMRQCDTHAVIDKRP